MSPESMAVAADPATLSVLVVGTDTRYRERARTVVGELGDVAFAVAEPSDPDGICVLVRRQGADVVVLDATGCEPAVARVVATLAAKLPRLGVVVVCEHLTDAARDLGALPKWGWRSDLRAAVQHAHIDGSPFARPGDRLRAGRRDLRAIGSGAVTRR